jgi:imidazolonepropionase-like amidohydrolase
MRHASFLLLLALAAGTARAGDQVAPPLPSDAPPDALHLTITLGDTHAGDQLQWRDADGTLHARFQFNDRGRGPTLRMRYVLDAAGVPTAFEATGNDYFKAPVDERFSLTEGRAAWASAEERGEAADAGAKFFAPFNAGLEAGALLVMAAERAGGRIGVLPGGEVRALEIASREVSAGERTVRVTLFALSGMDFADSYLWLDADGAPFLQSDGWFRAVRVGFEDAVAPLIAYQEQVRDSATAAAARRLGQRATGPVVFEHVAVFDAARGRVNPDRSVVVEGARITKVAKRTPRGLVGATVIDGTGKTLIPGLWDMHAHLGGTHGTLDIANGVTGARDMGNDPADLLPRIARYDAGTEIGPHAEAAGFIDGRGPFQGPLKSFADTPEEAAARVQFYYDHGYRQIKLYSSLDPKLVPVLARMAHARGLRVSGHIPAGMVASQAVRAGYDEIQHVNMLALEFMPDVTETRTPERFHAPGQRFGDVDLGSPAVRDFLALLVERRVVIDPTLSVFENTFCARKGEVTPDAAWYAERLPVQVQRGLRSGGLPTPDAATGARYCTSFEHMKRLVKAAYDAGVTIVPGTDSLAGFALHRELELYVALGIPPVEVLKLATRGAAVVAGHEADLGLVAPGMVASLVLVDGDPTQDITRLRDPLLVMRAGVRYDPKALLGSVGVSTPPRGR